MTPAQILSDLKTGKYAPVYLLMGEEPYYIDLISDYIEEHEQQYATFMTEDAELIMAAYGTMSRACRAAVIKARAKGIKLGLIQIKTIWPFPKKVFSQVRPTAFLAVEMSIITQMGEDVALAARNIVPVYTYPTGGVYPTIDAIITKCQDALQGKVKEV